MDPEDFENAEFHSKGEWCFLCKNITSTDPDPAFTDHHDSSYRHRISSAVKILINYLIDSPSSSSPRDRREREELQSEILSSFKNGKCSICAVCLCRARNLLELHLELGKIQMLILDDLRYLQDYLGSSVPVLWKDDVVLTRFQDFLQREFLCRNLSDGTQVRLERLRCAGYKNTSSSFLHGSRESEDFVYGDGGNGYRLKSISSEEMMSMPGDRDLVDGDANDRLNSPSQDATNFMEDIKPLALVETEFHDDGDGADVEAEAVGGRDRDLESCGHDNDNNEEEQAIAISSESENDEWLPKDNEDDLEDDDDDKPRHSMAKRPKRTLRLRRESDKPRKSNSMTTRGKEKRKVKRNLLWKCDICLESIPAKEVRAHMRSHQSHQDDEGISEQTSWECDICLENIPGKEMKLHLESHPEFEKIYKCEKCPQSQRIYGSYKGLIWHYLRGSPEPHADFFQLPCILCPAEEQSILYKKAALCKHLYEIHHPTHKKLPCKVEGCPKEFYNPLTQRAHSYQEHSSINKCEVCLQIFKSKQDLNYHLKSHQEQLQCASCPKLFKNEITLLNHEKTHEEGYIPEKVQCPECSQLILKTGLKKHLKVMHSEDVGQGWLPCKLCKSVLKTPSRLASHMKRIHEQVKIYKCPHPNCPRQFKAPSSLRFHVKAIHVENDMVQCPHCPKMYLRFLLATHIYQVHQVREKKDADRKYTCPQPECSELKWNSRQALEKHLKGHKEKILKCRFCPEKFAKQRTLELHERTHTTEKTFQCDLCPERFYSKHQRYDHKRKVHDGRPLVKKVKRKRENVGGGGDEIS